MTKIGKKRCGCDCKNQTVPSDQTVGTGSDLNCCTSLYPNGTPPRYKVTFECEHDWPLYAPTSGICQTQHPLGWPVGVYPGLPQGDADCDELGHPLICRFPPDLAMTYPVMELKHECSTGVKFTNDITTACSYSQVMYLLNGAVTGSCFAVNSVFASRMVDLNNPGEDGRLFPPYETYVPPGPIVYRPADYDRDVTNPPVHWEYFGGDAARSWVTLWHLDFVTEAAAYLEWRYDYVLGRMNNGAGKPRPRYEAIAAWDLWGRNTMHLTNPNDWPTLPGKICVESVDKPKTTNRCTSHAYRCLCCDVPIDSAQFYIYLDGCTALGVIDGYFDFVRIQDPADVPCGVTAPTDVCGFWWGEVTPDDPCVAGATGTGLDYTGKIGIAAYCTGSGTGPTGGPPMTVEMYCEYAVEEASGTGTTTTYCWDGPYAATVNSTGCSCAGWSVAFTAGDLPCCTCPTCCDCNTLPASSTLTGSAGGSLSGTKDACPFVGYTMAGGTINGETIFASTVRCTGAGVWTWAGTLGSGTPFSVALTWDGDCEAILLTGTFNGGTVTVVA